MTRNIFKHSWSSYAYAMMTPGSEGNRGLVITNLSKLKFSATEVEALSLGLMFAVGSGKQSLFNPMYYLSSSCWLPLLLSEGGGGRIP